MKEKELNLSHNQSNQNEFDDSLDFLKQYAYDDVLEDESDITMDLSFEEFLQKVDEGSEKIPEKQNKNSKRIYINILSGVAACGLIVLGSIVAFRSEERIQQKPIVEVVHHQLKINKQKNLNNHPIVNNTPIEKNVEMNAIEEISNQKEIAVTEEKVEVLDPAQQELVVVNGEVITDEQHAEEIALETLKLLAKNLSKGNDAVHNLKHLSIEL